jgi:hypothetical protein
VWGRQKKIPGFLTPRKLKEISVKLYDPVVWLLRNLNKKEAVWNSKPVWEFYRREETLTVTERYELICRRE